MNYLPNSMDTIPTKPTANQVLCPQNTGNKLVSCYLARQQLVLLHIHLFCYLATQTSNCYRQIVTLDKWPSAHLTSPVYVCQDLSQKGGKRFLPFFDAEWGSGGRRFKSSHPDFYSDTSFSEQGDIYRKPTSGHSQHSSSKYRIVLFTVAASC